MKRKSLLFAGLLVLLSVLTFCLVACGDGWIDKPIDGGASTAEIYSLSELNIYLGKGVLLPSEEADKIILDFGIPIVKDDFYEEPKCYKEQFSSALIEVDEYDLKIKVKLTQNLSNQEDIVDILDEYDLNPEICSLIELGNKNVIKCLHNNQLSYRFIDRSFLYEVSATLENDKGVDENILEVENFILAFKRYSYY